MDPSLGSNLSFFIRKSKDVYYDSKEFPVLSDPHDVLLSINYTGICGSDIHLWENGGYAAPLAAPIILGHESSGTIVRVGDAVKGLSVGDRVAMEPGAPCRRCEECLNGRYNLCPDIVFAACPPVHGTLTGYYVLPADFCYKLPEHMPLTEGALIEPLAVAVHIVRLAVVVPGQSVVVMGSGPVGLLCGAVAKVFGASTIVSVDVLDRKLEFAKYFCATHTYKSLPITGEENAANIKSLANLPKGADVVLDASGFEISLRTGIHVIRAGGTYVQGGMGKPDLSFPIMTLCSKEAVFKGSFRYSGGDYKLALELASTGKVNLKSMITKIVPFSGAEEAYKMVKAGKAIKILIAGPNESL